jgi:two-component system OmpR family response regulator
MTTPHLLLVEDDREISGLLERFLIANELDVSIAADGRAMDRVLAASQIDLIVLDVMLPGEDGLSLCRRLRATSSVPIIMLTAKGEDIDRIIGLEMGADDYLAKPFNPRELLARVKAVLRRGRTVAGGGPGAPPRPEGTRVAVTGAEFDLLQTFCERPGRVLSRDQLIELKQGRTAGPFERSIDVLVSRLRQKIEADPRDPELIKTIRSGGYLFTPSVERMAGGAA